MTDFESAAIEKHRTISRLGNETVAILENWRNCKMVHFIHVYGRQHNTTLDTAQLHVQLLWEAVKHKISQEAMYHGICWRQTRIRYHPSWLRREVIRMCTGEKGVKRLNEIWYYTCVFRINLKIEANLDECLERDLRDLIGQFIKVDKFECTGGGLNDTTKRMRTLRDEIQWLIDGSVTGRIAGDRQWFGEKFGIGRDI